MIPEKFRESNIVSYYDADQGWTDMWESWANDEFVLDPTRVTLSVGGTGWDGDTFKTKVLMDKYGIQINKTSRNSVLFMTNIGTTRSSVAYLIEGLHETFTVNALGLPPTLMRCLCTTNIIENPNGIVRRTSRRVTRYRDANMALRWSAAGFLEAEKSFRKVQGVQDLWILKAELKRPDKQVHVDQPKRVA
jgi:hypothetical protein